MAEVEPFGAKQLRYASTRHGVAIREMANALSKVRPWMAEVASHAANSRMLHLRIRNIVPRSWMNAKTVESACKPGPVRLAA